MIAEGGRSRFTAGAGWGRVSGPSLAERREAAQRRLTSMAETAEAVEHILTRLDGLLDALGAGDPSGVTRESVRAVLGVAARVPGYDATLALPAVRVRVRNTPTGLDIAVAPPGPPGLPASAPPSPGSSQELASLRV